MTIQLPPELESEAMKIPDIAERVVLFLRDQLELEQWRNRRYSPEDRALVERAFAKADELRKEGGDAESSMMLRRALDGIATQAR